MEKCGFEKYLVDYLNADLPVSMQTEMNKHLKNCQSCFHQLREIEPIQNMLSERKRPEPTADLYHLYQQGLSDVFESKTRFKNRNKLFSAIHHFLNTISPWNIRLAGATMIFIIGIIIGKIIFKHDHKTEQVTIEPTIVSLLESQSESKLLYGFFSDSEILLLEILNSNLHEEQNDKSYLLSKNVAQKLLMRTFVIHEIAIKLDNQSNMDFLVNLDFLLYNIANSDESEIILKTKEIRDIIKRARLLEKTRLFQKLLDDKTRDQT